MPWFEPPVHHADSTNSIYTPIGATFVSGIGLLSRIAMTAYPRYA
jgi:hypothetical protein